MEVQEKEKRLGIIIRTIDFILKERDENLVREMLEKAKENARELLVEEEKNSPLVSCINVPVDGIGLFEVRFKEPVRGLWIIKRVINQVREFIQAREDIVEFKDYVVDGLNGFFVVDIKKLDGYKMKRIIHDGRLIAYVWYKEGINSDIRREVVDSFVSGEFKREIGDGIYVSYNVEAYINMTGEGES